MGVLSGWAYRKAITINHTDDGAQTNYQMPLQIIKGVGVDFIGTMYLNNHCLNWPIDILITKADGTTVVGADFYRVEYDAVDGAWWLEADSIPDGGIWTGFVYYGKLDAADASSLVNTFGVGMAEDFEWGANGDNLSTNGGNVTWTVSVPGTSTIKISTAQCYSGSRSALFHRGNTNCEAKFTKAAGADYAVLYRIRKDGAAQDSFYHGNGTKGVNPSYLADESMQYYDGSMHSAQSGVTADEWHLVELNNFNWTAYTWDYWIDGVKKVSGATCYPGFASNGIAVWVGETAGDFYLDSILIRKWTTNEPTWGANGLEEALGGGIIVVRNKLISIGREPIKRMKFNNTLKLK